MKNMKGYTKIADLTVTRTVLKGSEGDDALLWRIT